MMMAVEFIQDENNGTIQSYKNNFLDQINIGPDVGYGKSSIQINLNIKIDNS